MKNMIWGIGAVAVILFGIVPIAQATPNSNSIIQDGIEYYIQTNKAIYDLGENVEMLYRVTNFRQESVTFWFGHDPVYQFKVQDEGSVIWSAPSAWLQVVTNFTLTPGEYREFPDDFTPPYIWNMRNNQGQLVDLGSYEIIGRLYDSPGDYDDSEIMVSIDIVPEPSSFMLFIVGIYLFRRKH